MFVFEDTECDFFHFCTPDKAPVGAIAILPDDSRDNLNRTDTKVGLPTVAVPANNVSRTNPAVAEDAMMAELSISLPVLSFYARPKRHGHSFLVTFDPLAEVNCRPRVLTSSKMAPQSAATQTPSPTPLPKSENHHFPIWAIVVIAVVGLLVASLVFYLFIRRHHHGQSRPARAVAKGNRAPSSAVRVGQRIGR